MIVKVVSSDHDCWTHFQTMLRLLCALRCYYSTAGEHGNVFHRICPYLHVCVSVSVLLVLTFERFDPETSFQCAGTCQNIYVKSVYIKLKVQVTGVKTRYKNVTKYIRTACAVRSIKRQSCFRPPDVHVGGLMFYHGFFLLLFRQLPSALAEQNSTKTGHVLGNQCDLKMHVQNLGTPSPYK